MKFEGIMKIQLSLAMSDGVVPFAIAYDERRRFFVELEPSRMEGRMGDTFPESHKRFFWCIVEDDDSLVIGGPAPWQDW